MRHHRADPPRTGRNESRDFDPDEVELRTALGETLRRLRAERNLSTRELATLSEVSPGFISQVENGIAMPSVATLVRLAGALKIQVGELFEALPPTTNVIRRDERPRYEFPDRGIVDEIVSSDSKNQLEVLIGHIEPGGGSGDELYTHGSISEFVMVLSGVLELRLGDQVEVLESGDSATFSGDTPHGYKNIGKDPAEIIWAMTPATY